MAVGEEERRLSSVVFYGRRRVLSGRKKGPVIVDEDIVEGGDMAAMKIPASRCSGNAGDRNGRWSCERKLRKVARLNEVGAFLSWAPTRLASPRIPFPRPYQIPMVSTSILLQQNSNK